MEVFTVNGLRVIFQQKKCNTVYMGFRTSVGSTAEEDPKKYGIAHFLEHMMFKGTARRDNHQIALELGKLGNGNAYTNYDETCYYITTLPENLEPTANLLFDIFFHSRFPDEELAKEKNVILEEHQMYEDDPSSYFYNRLQEKTVGSYGHSIIGTRESISGTTKEYIQEFVDKHYNSSNVILCVCGPITKSQLVKAIEKQDFVMKKGPKYKYPDLQINRKTESFTHNAKQSIFCLVYENMNKKESFNSNFVDSVFRTCLGGGFGSLLVGRIREELGLCYYISCSEWSLGHNSETLIMTGMDRKNIDLARKEINKIVNKVRKEGFDAKTLDFAKNNLKYKIAGSGDSSTGEVNTLLALYDMFGKVTKDDLLSKVEKISNKDLIEYGEEFFVKPKMAILNPEK